MFESPSQIRRSQILCSKIPQSFPRVIASSALHFGLIAVLLHHGASHPVTGAALPGTPLGSHVELTYLAGRLPASSLAKAAKSQPARAAMKRLQPNPVEAVTPSPATLSPPPRPHLALSHPEPTTLSPTSLPASSEAAAGSDSLGSGNIQIALTTYSPSPRPDLSQLPQGVQGDVILDVTIDPTGKVAEVAVVRTLGYGIDEAVIDTVRTWTFRPATRDGLPVASAQDVLFHYGPV